MYPNMRGIILLFIVGVLAGALALNYFKHNRAAEADALASSSAEYETADPSVMEQARAAATDAKENISDKLDEWDLTGSDIKEELRESGKVVRRKALKAGESIATVAAKARVIGTIKAKFALDRELSARDVDVDYSEGKVTLRGTVPSESTIGKAVALALDTDGVEEVQSLLTAKEAAAM